MYRLDINGTGLPEVPLAERVARSRLEGKAERHMTTNPTKQDRRVSHSQKRNADLDNIAALSFRQHVMAGEYAETIALTRGVIDSSKELLAKTAKSFPDRPRPRD